MIPLIQADAYKVSHEGFQPDGTEYIYSNQTARTGRYLNVDKIIYDNKTVFFGLQIFCKEFLINEFNHNFFFQPKTQVIAQIKRRFDAFFGKDKVDMKRYEDLYDLGYLPIRIKALPEGAAVPYGVPYFTIVNTNEKFAWLTNYLETVLSCEVWKPCYVATLMRELHRVCKMYANETVGNYNHLPFQLHGFEFRGMSGRHDAAVCAAAFLLFSCGTDTIPAVDVIEQYYNADATKEFIACSVPASEHAVSSIGTAVFSELDFYRDAITKKYPTGIVSLVSDTYDYFKVITEYATILKDDILNRQPDSLGLVKTVFRPDCYSEDTSILTSNGWKLFSQLNDDDLVAQVNNNNEYEFVKPIKIIKQKYNGKMHHFKDHHGKVNLVVTPNHRMILRQNGKERVVLAEKMGKHGHDKQRMWRSASAPNINNTELSDIDRLKIAFQADGSFCTKMNSAIRFHFTKSRKISRMESLLNKLGLSYEKYIISTGGIEFNIKVNAKQFQKDFNWVDISNLNKKWCEEFIEEASYWDSTRRSSNRFKFDTSVKSVADVVEYIAIGAGYGVLTSLYKDERKEHFSDIYSLHILKDNTIGGQSWENTVIDYDGMVYCVQVPTGKIVVKRDRCIMVCGNSGDQVDIICGDINAPVGSPQYKGTIECLWDIFGGTVNAKGYKELNPKVGAILGDGCTQSIIIKIFERLRAKGFAANNIVFGIGSFSLNMASRDSIGAAQKATWAQVNGVGYDLFKDPITDTTKMKKSAKGLLRVDLVNGEYKLKDQCTREEEDGGELTTVFLNGVMTVEHNYSDVRARAQSAV